MPQIIYDITGREWGLNLIVLQQAIKTMQSNRVRDYLQEAV